MKLQVTKAQNVDQMGLTGKNERGSDTCNLKMQSYIYGASKKGKLIQMSNNTNNFIMTNKMFTPSAELKSINVQFSNKAQLGRPVDPNSARQKRLATAPGRKTGRPINPNSARQQRLATAPGKKTGRPINPNSARQQRLCELEAKRIANGGTLKRGRPVNPNSARQIALREAISKAVAEQG